MRRIDFNHISWRDALIIGIPLAILVAVAFLLASRFIQPAPPDRLVLSTGAPGGDYFRYGERYREFFARYGVTLELRPSNGSVENAGRLQRGEVDAAFVQGGTIPAVDDDHEPAVVSLGALYPEVVWVFVRDDLPIPTLAQLRGRRVAIGPEGSGLRPLALTLLGANGITPENSVLLPLVGTDAIEALARRDVDALFLIGSPILPNVVRLLWLPGVRPLDFARGEAYARRFAALSGFEVPRGVSNLASDLPRSDVHTLAVTANLLVRNELHPALMYLLLDAASVIHGRHSVLADAGVYPNARNQDVPLADEAERFHRSGKPFLKRYLPYWLANLADRLLILLIPLFAVLLPVMKFLPDIYAYRIRRRITRWYVALGAIEDDIGTAPAPERVADYLKQLDEIETQVNDMNFPSSGADQVYVLRAAIDLVRERLGRPGAKAMPPLRRHPGGDAVA